MLAVVVIVLLAGLGLSGTWLLSRHKPAAEAGARLIAAKSCSGPRALTLVAQVAPDLAVPVTRIATDWAATNPQVQGRCVQLELSADAVDQQERTLANGDAATTSIWLPDSSTWAQRLVVDRRTDATGAKLSVTVHPSVASSPLVAVAAPALAARLTARLSNPDYDPLAGAVIAEPVHNAEGLLALLSEAPATSTARLTATQATVGRLLTVSKTALVAPQNGFDQLAGGDTGTAPFVASEQAVLTANQQHGELVAAAVYPTRPTLSLDFPVVRLSRPGDDPALAQAADQFERQLRTASARSRFTDAGLRPPDGTPLPGSGAATGLQADLVPPAPAPTPAQTLNVVRLWNAAVADSNTLAVIDLSGSMNDPAGNGQSKVAVAAAAASQAISFYPDTSALGLWVFSSDQGPDAPWQQLVALGPLSDRVGLGTRRQALLAADQTMPRRVHGGTALYDTVLAAYQSVKASFDPSKANSVVLMTDGRNEDTTSTRTLPQLLNELAAARDPAEPIRIITIGIGSGADAAALTQISGATGGKYYAVSQASDISGVFLDAVAQRN